MAKRSVTKVLGEENGLWVLVSIMVEMFVVEIQFGFQEQHSFKMRKSFNQKYDCGRSLLAFQHTSGYHGDDIPISLLR